nr:integrase, catalytic region, zinc finger, CCHC-type, peptidase aspartic, catalytic [Tanacetum cinerariifolium]
MNPQETQQVVAHDEKWVPTSERVKIRSTNMRLETTVQHKKETFQLWYTIKKVQGTDYYEFLLANKKCKVDAEVFQKIMDICPRVEGEEFTEIKQLESYQMFIKYSTGQIPPKKSRGKVLQGKKTVDVSQENVDISEGYKPEPVKKKTGSRKVKKKVTILEADNIIFDPDVALKLGKSISLNEAAEEEAARQVHATHARIVTESVLKPAKRRPSNSSQKLKGVQALTPKEQEVADTMKAIKESRKTSRRHPSTRGSSKGTGAIPGFPNESTIISATSKEDQIDDEEKNDKDGDADDECDDHISDIQDTDDEDAEPESDEDEIYKYKIRFHKDEDEEMTNDEVEDSRQGDAKISNVAKADVEKTEKVKDDAKKAKLPPTSSSLSVSLGFGDQFLKLSSDTSLVSTVKDTTNVEINSWLDIKIQSIPTLESSKIQTLTNLEQGSKKSAIEILKIKRKQAKKQKMPKYTIKSTNKVAIKEYDQKSALYQTMHENKSFNKNHANNKLYHALMEALKEDKNAMDKEVTDTVKDHKRKHHDDDNDDDDEAPPARQTREPVKEPINEVVMDDAGEDVVCDDDQPQDTFELKTSKTPNLDWFKQPPRPPTPDPEWNKRQVVFGQPEQSWFNQMVSATKDPLMFNDLMATHIDFSKYVLNRLKNDNLTQDLLLRPAYNLLKGTCASSIELEYSFQECCNALIDKLDWSNREEGSYPFDLSKPLPLQSHPGNLIIAADYFFNNDLEYLKSSDLERTYTTSITKIKATWYKIVEIKDMGGRRKLWHRSQLNKFSKHKVYSTQKILGVKSVSVKKLHGYGHLEEIVVKRADKQLYKFKEGDFMVLHLNYIKDMLLLTVQYKLLHLNDSDIVDFIVALRMFTRSLVIKKRVKDLQLNKRVMRADELYKFSDETLKNVQDEIHHRVLNFCLGYNDEMSRRKWMNIDKKRSQLMDKQMRERRIIRNLERLVGARELEMDYKLMTRTSDTKVFTMMMEILLEPTSNKLCDLLVIMSELKNKIKTIKKGKNVNTKFDKSETLVTLLCVTPLPKNIVDMAKKVSNTKVNADRPKSKDTKSNDRVLKNTNDKISSAHVRKMSSSVSIDSNKGETINSTVIQLVLWIVGSGCSKHMTRNLQLLRNLVEKFMGTVHFRNDHFAAITGYRDYVQGNLMICHAYYVEGLGRNLFSVGQFCDGNLEVAFRLNTCYVLNLAGDDLLNDSRESNLYTISISKLAASSPVF